MDHDVADTIDVGVVMIEADLVDCMVALPGQLFYSTQIPTCLWFLARDRRNGRFRDRGGEILFIDARKLGRMVDRTHRELTDSDIARIAGGESWRSIMADAREVAAQLSADGVVRILQGGLEVDIGSARGPIRLGRGPKWQG